MFETFVVVNVNSQCDLKADLKARVTSPGARQLRVGTNPSRSHYSYYTHQDQLQHHSRPREESLSIISALPALIRELYQMAPARTLSKMGGRG